MSDPLLERLNAPMTSSERAFWEAVAPDGQRVTIEALYQRLDEVLTENPDFIRLPEASSYALYSGDFDASSGVQSASMYKAAISLAENSNGAIGIIDNTDVGKSMGLFGDLAYASQSRDDLLEGITKRYGDYIDFDASGSELGEKAFTDRFFAAFDNPSKHFAQHATGDIISLTPNAQLEKAYARMELPTLLRGLEEGRIQSINGLNADDLSVAIEEARLNGFATIEHKQVRGTLELTEADYPYNRAKLSVDGRMVAQFDDVTVNAFIDDTVDRVSQGQPPFTVETSDAARSAPDADARTVDPDTPDTRTQSPDADTTSRPVSPEPSRGPSVFRMRPRRLPICARLRPVPARQNSRKAARMACP